MKAFNPFSNTFIQEYQEHSPSQIEDIIQNASKGFAFWSKISFSERSIAMKRLASILQEDVNYYAELITKEMGKPIRESRAEILKCASACEYFAQNAAEFLKDEILPTTRNENPETKNFISFSPLGIILGIMPWNYPFWQVFRFAASAVMAGNVILLKHASNVPGCALAIEELFREANFPDHILQTLLIDTAAIPAIIEDNRISAVTLTGSEKAGSSVGSLAGKAIKKTVLELGGSDPFIVLEDADLEKCIPVAVSARLANAGQSCIAAKRFIIHYSLVKPFCVGLIEKINQMNIGNPLLEETDLGPLAKKDSIKDLQKQIDHSINQGATLLFQETIPITNETTDSTSNDPSNTLGFFFPPTILTNIKKGMAVYDEETFGPVFAIIQVSTIEEAIAIANDNSYGLGASIWSQNLEQAIEIARKIESGSVFINGKTVSDIRLPFGGIKKSGYGRELSQYGIKEFVNIKTIVIHQ